MASKLSPKLVSLSLAAVSGVWYIICALIFVVAPTSGLNLFSYIFHGIDITQIAQTSVPFTGILIGFVEIILWALLAGWLFAVIYNYLAAKVK